MNINKRQKSLSLSLRNLVPQKMAMEEENFQRICFDEDEADARLARIRQPSLNVMDQILSRSRESSSRTIGTRLSSFRTATSRSIFDQDEEDESLHVMIERILGNASSVHTDTNKNQIEKTSTK